MLSENDIAGSQWEPNRPQTMQPDRWYVLGVLTIAYAFNIADRFSVSTLIEPIRIELALSDSGVGFLTGVALAIFYVTVGIPIANLADRANRKRILVISLTFWSAMTVLGGLAQNYWHLLLSRFGVGIGEAGGTPPSTSMLADKFPPSLRPLALTVFALGACLGAWMGSSLAGNVAQRHGWRTAFLVLGIPGVVLALVTWLTVREPARGSMDAHPVTSTHSSVRDTLHFISHHRAVLHLMLGASVATFWSWGLMWWTPTFLVRSHQMSIAQAGSALGEMHLIAGTLGTLIAGWLMTRRTAADPRHVARILAWVTLVSTVPSILVYWVTPSSVMIPLLWIFVPAVYFYIGPILGLLQNLVPAHMRATACAVLLFTANMANLVAAPQLVGWLSDWFSTSWDAGSDSLRWALLLIAPTGFWAAYHLWRTSVTIREDQARIGSSRGLADVSPAGS